MTTRLIRPAAKASRSIGDQLIVYGGVGRKLERKDDVHDHVGAEEQERQLQLSPHQPIDRQRKIANVVISATMPKTRCQE